MFWQRTGWQTKEVVISVDFLQGEDFLHCIIESILFETKNKNPQKKEKKGREGFVTLFQSQSSPNWFRARSLKSFFHHQSTKIFKVDKLIKKGKNLQKLIYRLLWHRKTSISTHSVFCLKFSSLNFNVKTVKSLSSLDLKGQDYVVFSLN